MNRRNFIKTTGLAVAATATGAIAAEKRFQPNILWLTSEDNGISWVSCYGGQNCKTPRIDQLAKEGFRYAHCFDNAAVCAPTRSTWITGMYAVSTGTQPMRSRYDVPHDKVIYYPDMLKAAGYLVGNGGKTDYNIGSRSDKECWKGGNDYTKRKPGQPFFKINNFGKSHESNAFRKDPNYEFKNNPDDMRLFSYHPDLPDIRKDYAKYADSMEIMDSNVGRVLDKLKDDGLYEDTIIIYCSDHGGVMARSKRFLYSSGIHCPMIVRIPEKWKHLWPAEKPGMTVDRIVSFVDMPKTWLSLAGAKIPETYQGKIFLGPGIESAPKYHYSFRERADEACDNVRGMRDERYALIKNYMPYVANGQRLNFMYVMKGAQAWKKHYQEGKCDEVTGRFFKPRPSEEFYDTVKDFDNVDNLIDSPKHQKKIDELRKALRAKQLELYDSGLLPEGMRLRRAKANGITIYEMVRDEKLYPLKKYLDTADMVLLRDPENLNKLIEMMSGSDEGMRWWGICGLLLLGEHAKAALSVVEKALTDDALEIRMMAAWIMDKFGYAEKAEACMNAIHKRKDKGDKQLFECVKRWMNPKNPEQMTSFVKSWMVLGTVADKSDKNKDAFALAMKDGNEWVPLTKGVGMEQIDLQETYGEIDNCSLFARTTIISPKDQEVMITGACDDKIVALVNDSQFVKGGGKIKGKVSLKKGKNRLMLKLIENGGKWYFWCRITSDGRNAVKGLKYIAE